jgi:hypothetical protein
MARTASGACTVAMTRRRPPQRGHARTSRSKGQDVGLGGAEDAIEHEGVDVHVQIVPVWPPWIRPGQAMNVFVLVLDEVEGVSVREVWAR